MYGSNINIKTCFISFFCSYGRVYAADPYNHTLTPAATYSVGAMVRLSHLLYISGSPICPFLAVLMSCIIPSFICKISKYPPSSKKKCSKIIVCYKLFCACLSMYVHSFLFAIFVVLGTQT